jgi:hypothetical protein
MAIELTVDFTGRPDGFDREAAIMCIEQENERLAALDPPQDPLPYETNAELKASYLAYLDQIVSQAHDSYKAQAAERNHSSENVKDLWKQATPAQRAAAKAALQA